MSREAECRELVAQAGPGLQRALVAGFGRDLGQEALSEALVYAWLHWDRIRSMANPAGYLYRVGYRWAVRAKTRGRAVFLPEPTGEMAGWVEPGLVPALRSLTERQRTAVMLIEGYGWTFGEVAALLGLSRGAVETHVRRGLRKLREALEVTLDA